MRVYVPPEWMRYREPSRGINPRLTDHLLSVGYLYTVQLRQYNYKLYIISVQRIPESIYTTVYSSPPEKCFCVYNCTLVCTTVHVLFSSDMIVEHHEELKWSGTGGVNLRHDLRNTGGGDLLCTFHRGEGLYG